MIRPLFVFVTLVFLFSPLLFSQVNPTDVKKEPPATVKKNEPVTPTKKTKPPAEVKKAPTTPVVKKDVPAEPKKDVPQTPPQPGDKPKEEIKAPVPPQKEEVLDFKGLKQRVANFIFEKDLELLIDQVKKSDLTAKPLRRMKKKGERVQGVYFCEDPLCLMELTKGADAKTLLNDKINLVDNTSGIALILDDSILASTLRYKVMPYTTFQQQGLPKESALPEILSQFAARKKHGIAELSALITLISKAKALIIELDKPVVDYKLKQDKEAELNRLIREYNNKIGILPLAKSFDKIVAAHQASIKSLVANIHAQQEWQGFIKTEYPDVYRTKADILSAFRDGDKITLVLDGEMGPLGHRQVFHLSLIDIKRHLFFLKRYKKQVGLVEQGFFRLDPRNEYIPLIIADPKQNNWGSPQITEAMVIKAFQSNNIPFPKVALHAVDVDYFKNNVVFNVVIEKLVKGKWVVSKVYRGNKLTAAPFKVVPADLTDMKETITFYISRTDLKPLQPVLQKTAKTKTPAPVLAPVQEGWGSQYTQRIYLEKTGAVFSGDKRNNHPNLSFITGFDQHGKVLLGASISYSFYFRPEHRNKALENFLGITFDVLYTVSQNNGDQKAKNSIGIGVGISTLWHILKIGIGPNFNISPTTGVDFFGYLGIQVFEIINLFY